MAKQYGLIVPKGKAGGSGDIVRPSIFDEDSESDSDTKKPTGLTTTLKRQDRLAQQKAIEDDPTVYQYDELYDEMEKKRKESKLARKDLDKKPKYINKLLATADRRKRENERRIERQVQKEREAEGEEFKDKESFVTSAYRKKLEEMKELEKQEQREDYLESIGDVTKQGNLDGFYRHLYDQKVLYEENTPQQTEDRAGATVCVKEEREDTPKPDDTPTNDAQHKTDHKKRKYRKRNTSSESDHTDEDAEKKLQHLPSNLDADSDFSIDSSDSDDENKPKKAKVTNDCEPNPSNNEERSSAEEVKVVKEEKLNTELIENIKTEETAKVDEKSIDTEKEQKIKKPQIDIWKKRTVGVVFDEALQRYYNRKSLHESVNYVSL